MPPKRSKSRRRLQITSSESSNESNYQSEDTEYVPAPAPKVKAKVVDRKATPKVIRKQPTNAKSKSRNSSSSSFKTAKQSDSSFTSVLSQSELSDHSASSISSPPPASSIKTRQRRLMAQQMKSPPSNAPTSTQSVSQDTPKIIRQAPSRAPPPPPPPPQWKPIVNTPVKLNISTTYYPAGYVAPSLPSLPSKPSEEDPLSLVPPADPKPVAFNPFRCAKNFTGTSVSQPANKAPAQSSSAPLPVPPPASVPQASSTAPKKGLSMAELVKSMQSVSVTQEPEKEKTSRPVKGTPIPVRQGTRLQPIQRDPIEPQPVPLIEEKTKQQGKTKEPEKKNALLYNNLLQRDLSHKDNSKVICIDSSDSEQEASKHSRFIRRSISAPRGRRDSSLSSSYHSNDENLCASSDEEEAPHFSPIKIPDAIQFSPSVDITKNRPSWRMHNPIPSPKVPSFGKLPHTRDLPSPSLISKTILQTPKSLLKFNKRPAAMDTECNPPPLPCDDEKATPSFPIYNRKESSIMTPNIYVSTPLYPSYSPSEDTPFLPPQPKPVPSLTSTPSHPRSRSEAPSALKSNLLKQFLKQRETLAKEYFLEFNQTVFSNQLPAHSQITWCSRLSTTAGQTICRRNRNAVESEIVIRLSKPVLITNERLRKTLLHECCHVAQFVIDCEPSPPHGKAFLSWASKATSFYPELRVSVRHDYEVHYKHRFECEYCHAQTGRQNALPANAYLRCGTCGEKMRELGRFNIDGTPVKSVSSAYSEFMKANFQKVKSLLGEKGLRGFSFSFEQKETLPSEFLEFPIHEKHLTMINVNKVLSLLWKINKTSTSTPVP